LLFPGLKKTSDEFFDILKKCDHQRAVMVASSTGIDEQKTESGIVSGHAYTLLRLVQVCFLLVFCFLFFEK